VQYIEFRHQGYSAIAVKGEGEWLGEFKFPIRRFVHCFFGDTSDAAESEFRAGIQIYLNSISQISNLRPESEGLAGIAELAEQERQSALWELQILDWPKICKPRYAAYIKNLATTSYAPISFNQAALDELSALMVRNPNISLREFKEWAGRVWRCHELERTREGLEIARKRNERNENAKNQA